MELGGARAEWQLSTPLLWVMWVCAHPCSPGCIQPFLGDGLQAPTSPAALLMFCLPQHTAFEGFTCAMSHCMIWFFSWVATEAVKISFIILHFYVSAFLLCQETFVISLDKTGQFVFGLSAHSRILVCEEENVSCRNSQHLTKQRISLFTWDPRVWFCGVRTGKKSNFFRN